MPVAIGAAAIMVAVATLGGWAGITLAVLFLLVGLVVAVRRR